MNDITYHKDTGIYSERAYVSWDKGDENICLDGDFEIKDLKEIVKIMEENQ